MVDTESTFTVCYSDMGLLEIMQHSELKDDFFLFLVTHSFFFLSSMWCNRTLIQLTD